MENLRGGAIITLHRGRSSWGCMRKVGRRDSRQCWGGWYMPEMASRLESGEIAKNTVNNCGGLWRTHVSPMRDVTAISSVRKECQAWLLSMLRRAPRACGDDPSVSPWGRARAQWSPQMRG